MNISKRRIVRTMFVAVAAWLFFSYVLLPLRIEGLSMEPTYRDGGFNFCWRQRYVFSRPERGDVVAIRLAGKSVVLLKRIAALEGDTVAFQDGFLLVNGRQVEEPYVKFRSSWNLAPRKVEKGKVYVIGDNRGTVMERHHFGQVSRGRILGGVLW